MSHLPTLLQSGIEQILREKFSSQVSIKSLSPIGGGCINQCGELITSAGIFFLKWNEALKFPGMLEAEAKGLNLLREPNVIRVPEILGVHGAGDHQFMVMEFINQHSRSPKYWESFGRQLAALHRVSSDAFGLDCQNYIGSLQQFNHQQSSWIDFFIQQRLSPQVEVATAANHFPVGVVKKFEVLYQKLPSLLPTERPSLLHGDLWSGNLMVDEMGEPCLIDPAVYFCHPETHRAHTQHFGGFDDRYRRSYDEAFPLTPGLANRVDLYNLYPLLVHVNLFGGGYVSQVNSILNRYIN